MSDQEMPDDEQKKPAGILGQGTIELSKQLIGCGGAVATALITGAFLVLSNSGVINRLFPPDPTLPSAEQRVVEVTSIVNITSTPQPQPTQQQTAELDVGTIGPLTFAAGIQNENPLESSTRFPQGITKIYALFSYENIRIGTPWRSEILYNGKLVDQMAGLWRLGPTGTTYIWQAMPDGYTAGEWEFRIYLNDVVARAEKFAVVAQPANSPYFDTIQFAAGFANGEPVNPYFNGYFVFAGGTTQITAYFRAVNMHVGTKWEALWYRNGDPLPDATDFNTWNDAANPTSYSHAQLSNPGGLAEGTYTLKLLIEGKVVQLTTFMVLPSITTAPAISTPQPTQETLKPGNAEYGAFTFAAGANNDNLAIDPSSTFPQSITVVVAVYPYELDIDSKWREEWYHNGALYLTYDGIWKGKPEGIARSWVSSVDGLPAGNWELKSYVADVLVQSGEFTIEPHKLDEPYFGAIIFAEGIRDGESVNPHEPRMPFASETIQVVAFFTGFNIRDDTQWTEEWYVNNKPLTSVQHQGFKGSETSRALTARLNSIQRLPSGAYTLKLRIGERVAQIGTVLIGD